MPLPVWPYAKQEHHAPCWKTASTNCRTHELYTCARQRQNKHRTTCSAALRSKNAVRRSQRRHLGSPTTYVAIGVVFGVGPVEAKLVRFNVSRPAHVFSEHEQKSQQQQQQQQQSSSRAAANNKLNHHARTHAPSPRAGLFPALTAARPLGRLFSDRSRLICRLRAEQFPRTREAVCVRRR